MKERQKTKRKFPLTERERATLILTFLEREIRFVIPHFHLFGHVRSSKIRIFKPAGLISVVCAYIVTNMLFSWEFRIMLLKLFIRLVAVINDLSF